MSTTPDSSDTDNLASVEPGGPVPPYAGRKESADIEPADETGEAVGIHEDDANVAGGRRPMESDRMKAPTPSETPGGEHAAPGDEQPAADSGGDEPSEPGTGPAHASGTPRGEDSGA